MIVESDVYLYIYKAVIIILYTEKKLILKNNAQTR